MGTKNGVIVCRGDEKVRAERRKVKCRWESKIPTRRRLLASPKTQFTTVTKPIGLGFRQLRVGSHLPAMGTLGNLLYLSVS